MRFDKDHWAFGFGVTPTGDDRQLAALAPMPGGGALASMIRCSTDGSGACTDLGVVSDGAGKAPPLGANGFSIQTIVPFASGDVWAFGRACTGTAPHETCILQVRRWKPDAKVAVDTIDSGNGYAEVGSVVAKDASDVIISVSDKYVRFDGAKWTTFAWSGRTAGGSLHAAPDGELWSAKNGVLERRTTDGTISTVTTPAPVHRLAGVEVGAPWIVANNAPSRWDAKTGTFETFTIPRSPFAWIESKKNFPGITDIYVRSARDVWLNVKYTEFPSHYAGEQNWEERRALLRSIPPSETLLCNNNSSRPFISAPPLATPECKTPLVILANVAAATKTDYPQSRKLVRGNKELEGTRYVEFAVDQRKILGAAVPSFDVGKKLLALMRANIPMAKPQMVCAAPSDAREISLE
jgi:hypothetical protein